MITLMLLASVTTMVGCGDVTPSIPLDHSSAAGPEGFGSIRSRHSGAATLVSQPQLTIEAPDASSPSLWTRTVGDDWPRFLGSTFDGKSTESGIQTDWSDGKLRTVWSMPVGTSYGIGAVANGRYFQHERVGDFERVRAVRAETGEELWATDATVEYSDMYGYNNGPRDTPAVDGNDVFTFGVAGRLSSHDTITGKLKWSVDTNTQYSVVQNFFGVGSSSLVLGNTVIVMVGGSPAEDAAIAPGRLDRVSPNGSAIVAFDRSTGKEIWKTGNDLASYSSPRLMVVNGKTIIVLLARDGLIAVEPESGKTLWQYRHRSELLESVNGMVPVVIGNRIFVSDCYGVGSVLLEINDEGYDIVWKDSDNRRQQAFRGHWATPIAVGDFLYGCSGRNEPDSDLRCIHWLTGKLAWSDQRRSRTSVMYVDQHFVVLDEGGEMQLIRADPTQLSLVTTIDLHEPAPDRPALGRPYWAAPILSRGLLYVRGSKHVVCLELIKDPEGSQD
jgi:outer membrane protein assembly factor BamB